MIYLSNLADFLGSVDRTKEIRQTPGNRVSDLELIVGFLRQHGVQVVEDVDFDKETPVR